MRPARVSGRSGYLGAGGSLVRTGAPSWVWVGGASAGIDLNFYFVYSSVIISKPLFIFKGSSYMHWDQFVFMCCLLLSFANI